MTLYLDTSNLVKLYVDEPGSDEIRRLVQDAAAVATSSIAYAETRATFARRRRERVLTASRCKDAADAFDLDWARFVVIALNDELAHAAGRLTDAHDVRGCDAIHLASFEWLLKRNPEDDVQFSCADDRLTRAAATFG
ncbi:MAG TPA: type II toxin-antitoxin system VapC family toxin [Vicinamibacterales bacterium]|nr:type II toxin-antitoxin system VapC family toxin [Vicinamibacterales bacterium]